MKNYKDIVWLFGINVFISAFTFGGGYVVIPMIRKYYVEKKAYFDEDELMKIAAIAQSSPGAIAINMSALAGYRVKGAVGLLISCIAAILPPLLILGCFSAVFRNTGQYARTGSAAWDGGWGGSPDCGFDRGYVCADS